MNDVMHEEKRDVSKGYLKPSDLKEALDRGLVLFAQNNQETRHVHEMENNGPRLELFNKSCKGGHHTAELDPAIAKDPRFQKAWRMGKVRVSADEAMMEKFIYESVEDERSKEASALENLRASMNNSGSSDGSIVSGKCLITGEPVMHRNDEPPLAGHLQDRKDEFISVTVFENGTHKKTWALKN